MSTFGAIARRGGAWLPVIGIAALADTALALALPYVLGRIIDAIVTGRGSGHWFALAGLLIAAGIAANVLNTFAGPACAAGTSAWLRTGLIRHLLALGPHRARGFDNGDLVNRVSGNAPDAALAGPTLVTVAAELLPPVGSLIMLLYIDVWIAVAFFAGIVLIIAILRVFARRSADVIGAYQQIQGRIAAVLTESVGGIRTIAAAGTVEREQRRILGLLPDLHEKGVRTWDVLSRSVAQAAVIGPFVLVAVLVAGGLEVVHGRITPGDLFAASQYAVLGVGLGGLTGVIGELARARGAARRIEEVLRTQPAPRGTRGLPPGPGEVRFRGVTVRAGTDVLLDGIDLTVPGGTTIAVVGPSGAGKSTLAALAGGLLEPDEGQVLLDGVPLNELSTEALRPAVTCAFERPVLVGATIAEAIGHGHERDRVRAAARSTHAHQFISRLPEGYDTPLEAAPLSGGEVQRLGLARAWHAQRVLVLDDATSSLDMVTEMQIGRTMTEDHAGRTRFIVTHRVSTASRADLVAWLQDGRLQAVGPHEQLWDDPAYRGAFG